MLTSLGAWLYSCARIYWLYLHYPRIVRNHVSQVVQHPYHPNIFPSPHLEPRVNDQWVNGGNAFEPQMLSSHPIISPTWIRSWFHPNSSAGSGNKDHPISFPGAARISKYLDGLDGVIMFHPCAFPPKMASRHSVIPSSHGEFLGCWWLKTIEFA